MNLRSETSSGRAAPCEAHTEPLVSPDPPKGQGGINFPMLLPSSQCRSKSHLVGVDSAPVRCDEGQERNPIVARRGTRNEKSFITSVTPDTPTGPPLAPR
jgi:hypothetical protein